MNTRKRTQNLVMTAALTALILLMTYVPFLGYIPLGFIDATIIHVPVIIGGILLGPKYGGGLGLVFGLGSLIKNTIRPNLTSFVFTPFVQVGEFGGNLWSIVICLVPRILIGVVAYYTYAAVRKLFKKKKIGETIALGAAGVLGSMTNTLLVMNLIYVFFGESYAAATGKAYSALYYAILGVIVGSGIPEAIVAAILTIAIAKVLLKLGFGRK